MDVASSRPVVVLDESEGACQPKPSSWLAAVQAHAAVPLESRSAQPSKDLCPFSIYGKCRYTAEACKFAHGTLCESCGLFALHPTREKEKLSHIQSCIQQQSSGPNLAIECGVCYERIAAKDDARFGLMNCEHTFCLSCVKTWRSQTARFEQVSSLCPLCRTVTHFVTPSLEWPSTPERKVQIVEAYKKRLSEIDCKHFNRGDGECPFGGSCFYAHRDRTGVPVARQYRTGAFLAPDGSVHPIPIPRMNEIIEALGYTFRGDQVRPI